MKYEFQANYNLCMTAGINQLEGIDYISDLSKEPPRFWRELGEVKDHFAKLQILAQANLTGYKDYARTGRKIKPSGLMALTEKGMDQFFEHQYNTFLKPLNLLPDLPDMSILPFGSWGINFNFKLIKPYISKDDTDFYVIDNPIKKEWVFKVPYIAPTQWKGYLRSVVRNLLKQEDNTEIRLLFGNEKKDDFHQKGRLHFYPTYFTRIGLEVMNPHSRETGAGTNPIYFETVPEGTEGIFTLLYVPLDLIGKEHKDIEAKVLDDFSLVAGGIKEMMSDYGFGAKTSSGFGLAESKNGKVISNIPEKNETDRLIEFIFGDFKDFSRKIEEIAKESGK